LDSGWESPCQVFGSEGYARQGWGQPWRGDRESGGVTLYIAFSMPKDISLIYLGIIFRRREGWRRAVQRTGQLKRLKNILTKILTC
jgi:hypothetical protein